MDGNQLEGKKIFKKITYTLLFVALLTLQVIHISLLENGKKVALIVLYLILYAPLLISIIFEKHVFALLIIIIYEIAIILIYAFIISALLVAKEIKALQIINDASEIFLGLFVVVSAIQYLRNKVHSLIIPCIILSIARVSLIVVSFIVYRDFSISTYVDLFRDIILVGIISSYIITFPEVELSIFKDEK